MEFPYPSQVTNAKLTPVSRYEESVGTFGATKGTEVIGGTADEAVSSTSSSEEDVVRCKGVDMVL